MLPINNSRGKEISLDSSAAIKAASAVEIFSGVVKKSKEVLNNLGRDIGNELADKLAHKGQRTYP